MKTKKYLCLITSAMLLGLFATSLSAAPGKGNKNPLPYPEGVTKLQQTPPVWEAFLGRWDQNADKAISEPEYARYLQWHDKRTSIKPQADANGDGQINPKERKRFKELIVELNTEYGIIDDEE